MDLSIIIGTRGSKLALWQANWVKSVLTDHFPSISVELKIIQTKGDKILDAPLAKVGGKGLFIKEIEDALLTGRIDVAVHSMKDMPASLPTGLKIGAVPERENPRDVLITSNHRVLSELGPGARIGTSSLRRAAQLRHHRPDVEIVALRGNIDTRLRKLEKENLDGVILAASGVKRLGLENRVTEPLPYDIMLPAAGQGALCIEIRENDPDVETVITTLDHRETRSIVLGERAFLNRLEGGCQVPMAALGKIENYEYVLCGLVADVAGKTVVKTTLKGSCTTSEAVGIRLAETLLAMGAEQILKDFRKRSV